MTTGMLSLTNGGNLSSFARGNAGNITINARDAISIDGMSSSEGPSGVISSLISGGAGGKGGYIRVTTGSLSLTNGAQLNASTYGQGPAGSVFILAKDAVSLTGSNTDIYSIVGSGGVGKGGDINIKAASLSLKDGAQLQSLVKAANNQPLGRRDAGNVNVDVTGPVTIAGIDISEKCQYLSVTAFQQEITRLQKQPVSTQKSRFETVSVDNKAKISIYTR